MDDLKAKPLFNDRTEAGRKLAEQLLSHRGAPDLSVLALLPGGAVVGKEIALGLDAPLEIFISKKLSVPDHPELAFGALTENGAIFLHSEMIIGHDISDNFIQQELSDKKEEILFAQQLYRRGRRRASLRGRRVILVDDGAATGAAFFSALQALRQEGVHPLISAIPVAQKETAKLIQSRSDEAVVLHSLPFFTNLGDYYVNFESISDQQIFSILKEVNTNGRKRAA